MKPDKKNSSKISRRKFVKATALSLSGVAIVPRYVLGGPGYVPPSDKVNIGIVGVGGRGKENIGDLLGLEDVQVTAIADPAAYWDLANFYYKTTAGRGPVKQMIEEDNVSKKLKNKVAEYEDFRIMLDKEKALDAILCATPDHMHAYVSLTSMRAGKHVYCEKPLTHNIWEARMVQKVARDTKLATQMGNQLHSTPNIRNAVEYLKAGAVGTVREVHSWVPATRWIPSLTGLPTDETPLPKDLNWDLWVGPRDSRPFHESYAPVTWRDFWEFGCGALGDFGCHDMDAATWGLDLPLPTSIEVNPAGFTSKQVTPFGEIGYYKFPSNKENPAIDLTWYSGGLQPDRPDLLPDDFEFERRGAMYIGDKGIMVTGGGTPTPYVFQEGQSTSFEIKEPTLSPTNGHHRDWVDAIKGGLAASSNFEYAARLTEITLLGVLSLRMGSQKINWDAENMKATGLSDADAVIQEPVRKGWEM